MHILWWAIVGLIANAAVEGDYGAIGGGADVIYQSCGIDRIAA